MKLHKEAKIEAITTSDKQRIALREAFLDISPDGAKLIATNGKAMAVIPVEVSPDDHAGYVSKDVLKAARKAAGRLTDVQVALNGAAQLPNGITMPRDGEAKDSQFPNWRKVWPNFEGKPTVTLAIDAHMLAKLAEAMGTTGVKLTVCPQQEGESFVRPVLVSPCGSGDYSQRISPACPEAKGIIMPIRTE